MYKYLQSEWYNYLLMILLNVAADCSRPIGRNGGSPLHHHYCPRYDSCLCAASQKKKPGFKAPTADCRDHQRYSVIPCTMIHICVNTSSMTV